MPKVLSFKTAKAEDARTAVYVGRPTAFGNPFVIGRDGTRAEVIWKFRVWLAARPALIQKVREELKGKNLICYCHPLPCHADVLLEVANSEGKEVRS